MANNTLIFKTELSERECILNITRKPWVYTCNYGTELWYTCEMVSDNQLLISFTGGQFRKIMRTQYWMKLTRQDVTIVTMEFYKELFGLPPMTTVHDIERFMKQKINAWRK